MFYWASAGLTFQMKHCVASILQHSPKSEDDGGRPSLDRERQSSFQGVARNDDDDDGNADGDRSIAPSGSDQYPRRPPLRLFLSTPGRERIPRRPTFSSAFPLMKGGNVGQIHCI